MVCCMFFHLIVSVILYYTHCHYSSLYSANSFIANVICYITIPSLNKVLYLVSFCILKRVIAILVARMAKVAKKYVIAIFSLHYDKWTPILTEIGVFHISKVIWNIFTA